MQNNTNETVVTFKNKDRVIAMYFTQDENGSLDMQMSVSPEMNPDEDPDLPMLLASTFLNVIMLCSLKNIAKKYNTLDEFFFAYSSAIKHNPDLHKEVLDLLKWGIENNQIRYGIVEFVVSQK